MKATINKTVLIAAALMLSCAAILANEIADNSAKFHDWKDAGCRMSPGRPGMGPTAAEAAGGNQSFCQTCSESDGQPRWWVDEPDINLWVTDQPLSYFTSSGKMTFRWYYRQRYKVPEKDECPTLYGTQTRVSYLLNPYAAYMRTYGMTNASWSHNWMMNILFWSASWENLPDQAHRMQTPAFSLGYEALVFRPEGGVYYLSVGTNGPNTLTDPLTQAGLHPRSGLSYPVVGDTAPQPDANRIYWGDPSVGFTLTYPDGSQDVFSLTAYQHFSTRDDIPDSTARAFLTQRIDPQGRTNFVGYEKAQYTRNTTNYFAYRVRYVVDVDNRTNTFVYNPTNSALHDFELAEVHDPYGRKATISYANGVISGITDAENNSSSFAYEGDNGWLKRMVTPYGTNTFKFYEVPIASTNSSLFSERAVYVSEPEGANQLFYYLHHTNQLATTDTAPSIPGRPDQVFDDGTTGTDHFTLDYRNSFHWDRRQFAALPSGVTNQLPTNITNALKSLTREDFRKARLKHWLLGNDSISITESLSSEREPSPDSLGLIEGRRNWYTYTSKTTREREGNPEISAVARVLDDGSTQYSTFAPIGSQWVDVTSGSAGAVSSYYQYSPDGIDLVSASNSMGQRVTMTYTKHLVTSVTDSLNQKSLFTWNASTFNLMQATNVSGQSVIFTYYPRAGNNVAPASTNCFLSSMTLQPQGRVIEIQGYTNGLPSLVRLTGTDLPEMTLRNYLDGLNRLSGILFPDNTVISNIFDRLALGSTKDRMGNWTHFYYDGLEHVTSVQDARGNTTQFTWCGCGGLTEITDPYQKKTKLIYNNQGLLTNVVLPQLSSRTNFYDSWGRLTNVVDGDNRSFTFGYNNQGQMTTMSNAFGQSLQVVYDALDRPWTVIDANGVAVTNQYDALNRAVVRTWQDGHFETNGYSTNGLICFADRATNITRFARDPAGRLTGITNANSEVVLLTYNALDQVIDLTDGRTNHTKWNYNAYGWLTNKLDALNHEVLRLAYDPNGRVTNRWTPEYTNTTYTYDEVGNLKTIAYPQSVSFHYDVLNRLDSMVDAVGTTSFGYTDNGELWWEDGPWLGTSDQVIYSYKQGLRMNFNLGSFSQGYYYDAARRLASVTSPAGSFTYGYKVGTNMSPASLVRSVGLPNAAWITNHFDSLNRMDYTALMNYWGHVLDGYAYAHDVVGLRKTMVRDLGMTTNTVSIAYDAIGQLTNWSGVESTKVRLNEQFGFGFDKAGNLNSRTSGYLTQSFANDSLNQISTITRSGTLTVSGNTPAPATSVAVNGVGVQPYADLTFAVTNQNPSLTVFSNYAQNTFGAKSTNMLNVSLPASLTLKYDASGNLTNDGMRVFFYDAENRLTACLVSNAWKSEFLYDGLGRCRMEKDYRWQTGGWGTPTNEVHYVCDGFLPIQERDAANNVLVTYTRGLDFSGGVDGAGGIGGLLARTDSSGASTFYHADGAGNITALIDSYQVAQARYEYSPFGKLIGKWGPLADANTLQFSSMPIHRLSGVVGYFGRAYDPILQRWLQRDPLRQWADTNPYRLNYNNPLSFIDPDGLAPKMVSVSFNLSGGQSAAGYADRQFGQNYGIGLHGATDWGAMGKALGLWQELMDWLDPQQPGMNIGAVPSWIGGPRVPKVPKLGRLNQLEKVGAECKAAPKAKLDYGPEHGKGNIEHNNAIEDVLDEAKSNGATDLRKNRVQRDANGNRVYDSKGDYVKPDASYIDKEGTRNNYNRVSNLEDLEREIEAFRKMIEADPNAINSLEF